MTEEIEQPRPQTMSDIQLQAVLDAINETGSKLGAARQLGVNAITVYRHIKRGFSDGRKFEIVMDGRVAGHPRSRVVWLESKENEVPAIT